MIKIDNQITDYLRSSILAQSKMNFDFKNKENYYIINSDALNFGKIPLNLTEKNI